MNILLLGAPGTGKGTHAAELVRHFKIPQVSTGDMLRQARAEKTALGKKAQGYMDAGKLVPDELIIEMIEERIQKPDCQKGAIFDGFPRTVDQARALEEIFQRQGRKLDGVLNLTTAHPILMKRLTGRRVCEQCGKNFNIYFSPPKKEQVCDHCGGKLIQRKDDNEETIQERLAVYQKQTAPLVDYFQKKKLLKSVPTDSNDVVKVTNEMLRLLGSK